MRNGQEVYYCNSSLLVSMKADRDTNSFVLKENSSSIVWGRNLTSAFLS